MRTFAGCVAPNINSARLSEWRHCSFCATEFNPLSRATFLSRYISSFLFLSLSFSRWSRKIRERERVVTQINVTPSPRRIRRAKGVFLTRGHIFPRSIYKIYRRCYEEREREREGEAREEREGQNERNRFLNASARRALFLSRPTTV